MKFCIAVFVITFFAAASDAIDFPVSGLLGGVGGQQDGFIHNIIDTAVKTVLPEGALIEYISNVNITELSPDVANIFVQFRQTIDLTKDVTNIKDYQLDAVITGLTNVGEQIVRDIGERVDNFFASRLALLQVQIKSLFDAVQEATAGAIETITTTVAQIKQTFDEIYEYIAGIITIPNDILQNTIDYLVSFYAVLAYAGAKAINAAQVAIEICNLVILRFSEEWSNLVNNLQKVSTEIIQSANQ